MGIIFVKDIIRGENMDYTIEDFNDSADEIVRLYELLKPNEYEIISEEESNYFNSWQYKSHLYKFAKTLTQEQIEILNLALVIGYWLHLAPEPSEHNYLKQLNLQEVHVKDIAKWCAKLRMSQSAAEYLKTFTEVYLKECVN